MTVTSPDDRPVTVPASVQIFELASVFYQFRADITGLTAATGYSYRVAVDGQDLASGPSQFKFRTAPQGGFSFLAFGDSGACSAEQQKLIGLMSAEPDISMVLHLGDLAYTDGTFEQFESAYYGYNAPLMRRLPFFSTPGNHEYYTDFAAPYLSGIVAPESGVPASDQGRYYSFDWGDAHFVSLDSNLLSSARAAQMLAWLAADLAATSQHWRIVFLHHTPYPTGFHLGDPACVAVRQLVNPILERNGVQLVLAGHEHGYERTYPLAGGKPAGPGSRSTTYVVSGGGGGALESVGSTPQCALSVEAFHYLRVDVKGKDALTISAVGLDGGMIDRVRLSAETRVAIEGVSSKGGYTAEVAPGSLVSISGLNLAVGTESSSGYQLPTELAGTSVKAGERAMRMLYVSPTQIQAQIPYEAFGPTALEVSAPDGRAFTSITVSPTAPSLLAILAGGEAFSATNPARPGGRIALYLTGLGLTRQAVPSFRSGSCLVSGAVPAAPMEVWLGERRLEPLFVGLTAGLAGIHRVDVEIPADLDDGLYALCTVVGGASSRPANLDVVRRGTAYRRDRARTRVQVRF